MRAFDLSGADRQIIGQGFAIVQLISATYQIAMASAHGSLVVVHFGRFEMTSECLQRLVEAAGFERVLLRVDPGLLRGGLGRNRFRYLMNSPLRSSLIAWRISACVFITIGPCQATGSRIGFPETSRKRRP